MRFFSAAVVATTLSQSALAFTTPISSRQSTPQALRSSHFVPSMLNTGSNNANARLGKTQRHLVGAEFNPEGLVPFNKDTMLTPEGYGFTAPAKRIVTESSRAGAGYYRASSSQNVLEVVHEITKGDDYDVALIFDEETDKILGLFTESDYIKVSEVEECCVYRLVVMDAVLNQPKTLTHDMKLTSHQ